MATLAHFPDHLSEILNVDTGSLGHGLSIKLGWD